MLEGDKNYSQFYYKDAHKNYVESIEGYMELLPLTKDDANF